MIGYIIYHRGVTYVKIVCAYLHFMGDSFGAHGTPQVISVANYHAK